MLKGKKIVLGITGSIAAYKACLIVRGLVKRGAEVQVVITPAGKEFITPITLSALTHKPVVSDFFSQRDGTWHSHVDLGLWADAMLIAPCTASTLGKMANGIADNMLVTTYLSMKAPVFIAPAMDLDMYRHPSTRHNMATLRSYGNRIIEPGTGFLASGLEGKGRMEEPEVIVDTLDRALDGTASLEGRHILITAGGTREAIDPVRFVSNYSTGKMGFALAQACARRGADVTLVCGAVSTTLVNPLGFIRRIDAISAQSMYEACQAEWPKADTAILCAAVADFTPAEQANEKIKKQPGQTEMSLRMVLTPDIARSLGESKKDGQRLIGFALETHDEKKNALLKLKRKRMDAIVLNSLRDKGAGFGTDTNRVTILSADGNSVELPLQSKADIADKIIEAVII